MQVSSLAGSTKKIFVNIVPFVKYDLKDAVLL